jgi:hypothetical protein
VRKTISPPVGTVFVGHAAARRHSDAPAYVSEYRKSGRLEEWAKAEDLTNLEFVPPGAVYPASPKDEAVPSAKRYRFRVADE